MTSKGTTAIGRVTFEGGAKPASVNSIRITSLAIDTDGPIALGEAAERPTQRGWHVRAEGWPACG
jgi:hypothetical protein